MKKLAQFLLYAGWTSAAIWGFMLVTNMVVILSRTGKAWQPQTVSNFFFLAVALLVLGWVLLPSRQPPQKP